LTVKPELSSRLYLLGADGILFHQPSWRLYHLNTTASFIWCCIEEGLAPPAIADAVALRFDIALEQAKHDLSQCLAAWEAEGLLAPTRLGAAELVEQDNAFAETTITPVSPPSSSGSERPTAFACDASCASGYAPEQTSRGPADASLPGDHRGHTYRIGSTILQIRYGSRSAESLVHPIFDHLADAQSSTKPPPKCTLTVREKMGGFVLFRGRTELSGTVSRAELVPLVQREAILATYASTDCLAGFHAGAVAAECGCILLPGAPGSGKSTLMAALMAAGLTYLGDELALVTKGTHLVQPVPVSLGLKRGSWAVLAPTYPALETLETFRQADGTEVRYLPPPNPSPPRHPAYPVRHLVFPKFAPNAKTTLTPLGPAESLYRLAEAGYTVRGRLEQHIVEELIGWVGALDCYALVLNDLKRAVSLLRDLLQG
jgi:hypothetical protein